MQYNIEMVPSSGTQVREYIQGMIQLLDHDINELFCMYGKDSQNVRRLDKIWRKPVNMDTVKGYWNRDENSP